MDLSVITVADEHMHPPTDQRSWQESFYFNWSDVDGRSFGLTRIGLNPADWKADALLILIRDGQLEYVYPGVGIAVTAEEKFGAKIPDEEVKNLKTVGDAVSYIKANQAA